MSDRHEHDGAHSARADADMIGAFALDALTDDERARFIAAARLDQELQADADALHETAGQLAGAVPEIAPPAAMKADLMRLIASTEQEAPTSQAIAAAPPVAEPAPSVVDAEADAPAGATHPRVDSSRPAGPAERTAAARWFRQPARLAGAAAAALVLLVGGVAVGYTVGASGGAAQDAADGQLAAIVAAADAQHASATLADGTAVSLVWSESLAQSALVADDLSQLDAGSTYEAWYIDDAGTATPAGTFAGGDGTIVHVLDGTMDAGAVVGVTVEPDGGSDAPTTDPIVAFERA